MDTLNRRPAPALAAFALAALVAGCVNPFQPARPEEPTGTPVVPNFNSPALLLNTVANAIMNKGASGRNAYYDALADSTDPSTPAFYAFHDPAVVQDWFSTAQRDPPNPWEIKLEKRFYDYLISVLPFTYAFQWAPDNTSGIDFVGDTEALLHRYYQLQATSTDGRISEIIAVGYADLYMRKLNGRWYLYRWVDRVDPSTGVRPANLYNRSMGWRRLDSS